MKNIMSGLLKNKCLQVDDCLQCMPHAAYCILIKYDAVFLSRNSSCIWMSQKIIRTEYEGEVEIPRNTKAPSFRSSNASHLYKRVYI